MGRFTKTPYFVLFVLLAAAGVGTAAALGTITLAGDVHITGNIDIDGDLNVDGTITGDSPKSIISVTSGTDHISTSTFQDRIIGHGQLSLSAGNQIILTESGTVKNLHATTHSVPAAHTKITLNVIDLATSTTKGTIICTITTTKSCSNTMDSVSADAGNVLQFRVIHLSSPPSPTNFVSASVTLE